MYYRIVILFLLTMISFNAYSQTIKGKVIGTSDTLSEALPDLSINWINSSIGTTTDSLGEFELPTDQITDRRIIIRGLGILPDTIAVNDDSYLTVRMKLDESTLNEVIVRAKRNMIGTEVISKVDLQKSACCDLAGCFETQATVQPMTTNIITNSKELRILGLSGVYNQVLVDGMPLIQGTSYTYGISSIPGTLVDKIYVAKGANSVLQGFESISGSINVVLKQPDNTDKLLLNTYINSFGEKHLNANYSKVWNKWSTLSAIQTVQPAINFDRDGDRFLDVPKLTRYMLYNKWKYQDEDSLGWSSLIGIQLLNEKRVGGQVDFNESDKGSSTLYGQVININQPELYTKTGYRFNDDKKVTLIASSFYHDQNSYFGPIHYQAKQNNIYGNLQYEWRWREKHELKTGVSVRYVNLEENIAFVPGDTLGRTYGGNHLKYEFIPGVFAENIFKWNDGKIVWITGVRLDHHNKFGFFFTPRTQLKYQVTETTVVRISAGTGWRTINLFTENVNLLASSRDIVVTETLKPEQAFNWGINLGQDVEIGENITGVLSLDFYQTRFSNQIFPNYDISQTKAYISNFTGESVSNGFQVESNLTFSERFSAKLAYTYLDVYRMENGAKNVLPFNPKDKVLGSFSYMPLKKNWHADVNIHWFGEQRLPNTSGNPIEYQRPSHSDAYTIVNAQFTKTWKKLEVYGGCENIFDFRQLRPILGYQQPFGPYFDSSFAWGPTRGREFYLGLRFKIV